MVTSGHAVQVATVAPDPARVTAAHDGLGRQDPPPPCPRRLTSAAMDASFVRRWSRAPTAPLAGPVLQGGGGA